jgi:hypothetical protein
VESYPDIQWEVCNDCTKNYSSDLLNVINRPSRKMASTFQKLDLKSIAEFVLKSGSSDGQRKNKFCDIGFASDQNTGRSIASNGISKPRVLEQSGNSLLTTAAAALSSVLDDIVQPRLRFKAYRDKNRQEEFAATLGTGNLFEAVRFALTNQDHILDIHEDASNDPEPLFSGVVTFSSWLLLSDGTWWRLSIIGYSRRSIPRYIRRKAKYTNIIDEVVAYARSLPKERLVISPSLLNFPKSSKATMHHQPAHSNKCVYLSAYADCIEQLRSALQLTVWHLLALTYNVVDSESPVYFWRVTDSLLLVASTLSSTDASKKLHLHDPVEFGVMFYNLLWDLKEVKTAGGNKKRVPGQRHQPHNNIRQPDFVVDISIQNLFRIYLGVRELHPKQLADCHYFGRTVSRLENSFEKGGAYGAGPLTAQHITGVACLLGIFPLSFLDHAEIGQSTASYKYLRKNYGLLDHMEDTRQILEALSCVLELSFFLCENIVCKWVQSKRKTTEGVPIPCPYMDTVFENQLSMLFKDGSRLMHVSSTEMTAVQQTSADRCRVDRAMDKAINKAHSAFAAILWNVRYQAGRKLFPMKSSTRRAQQSGSKRSEAESSTSTLGDPSQLPSSGRSKGGGAKRSATESSTSNSVVPIQLLLKSSKADSQMRAARNKGLSHFSSEMKERKCFALRRLSKLALAAQLSSGTKFVLYERYLLGGFTFFRSWLRVNDHSDDNWAPTLGVFNFYPKSNSITVNGLRYYPTKNEAKQYSMFCAIFQHSHSFFRKQVLCKYLPPEQLKDDEEEYTEESVSLRVNRFLACWDAESVTQQERKEKAPFLGFVEYGDGTIGARLLENDGEWMKGSVMHYF